MSVAGDEAVPPAVQEAINLAYARWSATGSWPTVQWAQLQLRRNGVLKPGGDLALLVRDEGPRYFRSSRSLGINVEVSLTIEGLSHSAAARNRELQMFISLVTTLAALHASFTPDPGTHQQMRVGRRELESALAPDASIKPSDLDWKKLLYMLSLDHHVYAGHGGPDTVTGDFTLMVHDDVELYAGVGTVDEYLVVTKDEVDATYAWWMFPQLAATVQTEEVRKRRIFLAHGQDLPLLHGVELWLHRAVEDAEPVILMYQANRGQTLIEKFEREAGESDYLIAMLTGDDLGGSRTAVMADRDRARNSKALQPRARQNAILELGYAMGRLGRQAVAVIYQAEVERPSDIDGVAYVPSDDWKQYLTRELVAARFAVKPGQ